MTTQSDQARTAYNLDNKSVESRVGDDITKSAWRFEKKALNQETEKSEGWKVFALDNNILDPFQIAGDSVQFAEPLDNREKDIKDSGIYYEIADLEDMTVLILKAIGRQDGLVYEESRMYTDYDSSVHNSYFNALSNGVAVEVTIINQDIYVRIAVESIPFRPREMHMPTGEIITAGDEFVAGFYKLKSRR